MSRALALLPLLAACSGSAAPPPRAPEPAAPAPLAPTPVAVEPAPAVDDSLGIDWSSVTYATDEEALAIWARLDLDGENVADRLYAIPEKPAGLREAMARAILREGNFACTPIAKPITCDRSYLELPELGAEHRLGDPCLRRELALWALGELDDEALHTELAADMIALAGLPPPEEELNRAVFYRVTDRDLRLQMLDAAERAGNELIADEMVGDLSNSQLETAARTHHIDGAVIVLDVEGALPLYLDALADPALRPETRIHVAGQLGDYGASLAPDDPNLPRVTEALGRARVAADCRIAAAATDALELVTGESQDPTLGKRASQAVHARALCVALHRRFAPAPLGRLLGTLAPKGLVIEQRFQDDDRLRQLWLEYPDEPDANKDGAPDVAEADPDGDGDPTTWLEVERVPPDELPDRDIWPELARALATCTTAECQLPGQPVWFRLHWKKSKTGHTLTKIVRREVAGGCP